MWWRLRSASGAEAAPAGAAPAATQPVQNPPPERARPPQPPQPPAGNTRAQRTAGAPRTEAARPAPPSAPWPSEADAEAPPGAADGPLFLVSDDVPWSPAAPPMPPRAAPVRTPPPAAPAADPAPAPSGPILSGADAPTLYLAHFGLQERPFSLVPDPGFLFWSQAHRRAYAILEYGILTRAPITMITGEVGAGKTTLIHHLLRRLGPGVTVGLVSNAHAARGALLRWVLMALGQPAAQDADYVALFAAFQKFIIAQYGEGRRVVLIFDEAQNLDRDALEELRMLTNVNANSDELLQLVLVGQPELREVLHRPDMAQFTQRVAARFHLPAMELQTVHDYIEHRLAVAGAAYMLFDDAAVAQIHAATRGVPRLVNQLCDLALVYAYTEDAPAVTGDIVAHVLRDGVFVGGPAPEPPARPDAQTPAQPPEAGHDH